MLKKTVSVLLHMCPTDTHTKLYLKGSRTSWPWETYSDWSRTSLRKAEWENGYLSKGLVQFQLQSKGAFSKCTSLPSKKCSWITLQDTAGGRRVGLLSLREVSDWELFWMAGLFLKNASKCFYCQQWSIIIRTYAGAKIYAIYCYLLVR